MTTLERGIDEAVALFERTFSGSPTHLGIAPGRINLIGEHTDYQDGFVFPAAIDRYVITAARWSDDETDIVTSRSNDQAHFDASSPRREGLPSWAKYPAGVAWALSELGQPVPNIQAAIHATLPAGSGLSSSAALELSFGTLWRLFGDLPVENGALARAAQRAENGFVGMNCGIMDQTASLFGVADHALYIDTTDAARPLAEKIPDGLSIVICDTRVHHELTGSEYNSRRREAESAAAHLGVPSLRYATLEMIRRARLSEVEEKRARHIVSENVRVAAFRHALLSQDRALIGQLMRGSHVSLRDDYEVSCSELDAMAEAAWDHPACIGARMMGGGFGGACIALVEEDGVDSFINAVSARYRSATAQQGALMVCSAVDGARVEKL